MSSVSEALHDKNAWDNIAAKYAKTLQAGPGIRPIHAMLSSIDALSPFTNARTVMDVGCGPGLVLGELLSHYSFPMPTTRFIASDHSRGMIEQVLIRAVEEKNKGNAIWDRVDTSIDDAQDLAAHADGSVSHATASFVMFMLPDPQAGLRSVLRVLSPNGGVLGLTSWGDIDWIAILADVLSTVRPDKTPPRVMPPWDTADGVRGEMQKAGFADVETYAVKTYWEYDSPEEIVRFMTQGGFPHVSKLMEGMSGGEVQSFTDGMVKWLKERYGEGKGAMEGWAIVGRGQKGRKGEELTRSPE